MVRQYLRQGAIGEMVHDNGAQGQGEDCEGRHAAGSGATNKNVQCSGIQRCSASSSIVLRKWIMNWDGYGTDSKVVYRRYASLFFVCGISSHDNELATLEIIHRYVEVLDRYFGNVRVQCYLWRRNDSEFSRCRCAS